MTIQGWQRQQGLEQWVTVELHGDDVVFEETTEPLKDDGSETIPQLRAAMPDAFTSYHNTYKEHELHLTTNNQDRVKTAWQYIYSHGCTGKQSHLKSEVKGRPFSEGHTEARLILRTFHQLRQLRDIDGDAPCFIACEQVGWRTPTGLLLIVDIAQSLPAVIADDEARAVVFTAA